MKTYIDLNADLGEGFGPYKLGMDEEILNEVSSVNIACGWHGGDPLLMNKTIEMAKAKGVGIGAHPSYPDRLGFGRRNIDISQEEARAYGCVTTWVSVLCHDMGKLLRKSIYHPIPHPA